MGAKESSESRQVEEKKETSPQEEKIDKKSHSVESSPPQKVMDEYSGKEPVVEEIIQPVLAIRPMSVMNAPGV